MRDIGAVWLDSSRCRFRVWSPFSSSVELQLVSPEDRTIPMEKNEHGYHQATISDVPQHSRYRYRLPEIGEFADPASCYQPEGVHGPSQIPDNDFDWTDTHWRGIPIETYIIYELHVGTYTPEGTFEAIITHLDHLADVGITAIELMPIAQFPGDRNWGYDGVFPFAVQESYGGPSGLRALVDACHQRGIAMILDVVYNHLGPEGNYLQKFAPYFTDRYRTPWGSAINFDDALSDEVRHYFLQNALYWVTEFHVDALRLDAVHAILDHSAETFLEELAGAVHARATSLNRRVYTIAESALNDTRVIRPKELGGYGLDAQWNDDFHHALHTLLTGENDGYYLDFGRFQHMAHAFSEGFVYSGRYSVTRQRRHGNSSRDIPSHKFVVFAQNHDQIGNRMLGERLSHLVSFERSKLAAATVLLSPFIPMLFMGDEYGEIAPFQYFVSHSDPDLIEAVRQGRSAEFAEFKWEGKIPDPQDARTFQQSKLVHQRRVEGHHRILLEFHRGLIAFRKTMPALQCLSKDKMDVFSLEDEKVLIIRRWDGHDEVMVILNFNDRPLQLKHRLPEGRWHKRLDSADDAWMGPGSKVPADFVTDLIEAFEVAPTAAVLMERHFEE